MRTMCPSVGFMLLATFMVSASGACGGETREADTAGDAEVRGDTQDTASDTSAPDTDGPDGTDALDTMDTMDTMDTLDDALGDLGPETSPDSVEEDVPFLVPEEPFDLPTEDVSLVDEDGAFLWLDDGALLLVPPGALAEPVVIAVFRTDEPPPEGYASYSAVYRFEPSGLTFDEPVRVRLPFRGELESPVVYWSNQDGEGFDRLEPVMRSGTFVEVEVTHFSRGFVADGTVACMGGTADVRRQCGDGADCRAGRCVLGGTSTTCSPCNGTCRALGSDPSACGACGSVCVEGTSCVAGVCEGGPTQDGFARGPMPCRINFRYAWADALQTTVRDEVTGLVWQRGVHPNTPEPPTWAEAMSYCDGLVLDGHEDWRLPTRVELATIDGHSVEFPLEAPFFPAPTSALWTASTAGPDRAWLLDFATGTSLRAVGSRSNTGARCVRGTSGGATRQPLELTSEVVRDPNTGLVWQRRLHPAQTLIGAQASCGNLVLDGATDWAVATTYELQTLIDEPRSPAIDLRHFPDLAGGPEVWSRTLEFGVSWTVSFAQGTVQRRTVANQTLPFLCVRRAAPALGCKVCSPECQNGGLCEEQGFCTCAWTGHSGERCEVPICTSGCPNGGFCTAPDTCTCPAGRGGPNCAVCPAGTFSTGSDTQCRPCQPGTFSAFAGASSCTACPCGEVAPTQGATACLPCGAGRAAQPGESLCTTCGPGTIAPPGGCACGAQCGAGFEVKADRSACEPCAAGRYSEPGGECRPCTAYDPPIGCTVVDECALGVDDCDANATCEDTLGGYRCRCPLGTLDVNGDGTECATLGGRGLALGESHNCAIDEVGRLFCWGDNRFEQLGLGGAVGSSPRLLANPTRVGGESRWLAVAAGATHTCAIAAGTGSGGALHCWGLGSLGALGLGAATVATSPTRVGEGADWTDIAAAGGTTCGIRAGALYCWGGNSDGKLGLGDVGTNRTTPARVGAETNWSAISVGAGGPCGIRGGAVFCWGSNANGQLGNGDTVSRATPTRVGTESDWTQVSRGRGHACGLRDGRLWCWGSNGFGQLGVIGQTPRTSPVQVTAQVDWSQVDAGGRHTCARRGDSLFCWGSNDSGQLGFGDTLSRTVPSLVGTGWTEVEAGAEHSCGLREGRLLCWGQDLHGRLGGGAGGSSELPTRVGADSDWNEVDAAGDTTCGRRGGALFCWGQNRNALFGSDLVGNQSAPYPIVAPAPSDWSQVSVSLDWGWGAGHACGVKSGALFCWGRNEYGQLGLGDTTRRERPERVGNTSDWTEVATGARHTCGRRAGQLFCWGSNFAGQLGIGLALPAGNELSPVRVGTDGDWTAVTAGAHQTCGLRGGALYCWGVQFFGAQSQVAPVRVGNQTGWTAISAGVTHLCGLRAGELYCWGDDWYGALGLGLPGSQLVVRQTPTRVGTGTNWSGIASGWTHTCGRRGGQLFCWGQNASGQLGLGHRDPVGTPARVGIAQDWSEVALGVSHSCGRRGGQLYCWGLGSAGQLGSGDTWSPQPIVGPPAP